MTNEPEQKEPSDSGSDAAKLNDEDMLSLHDEGLTGNHSVDARPSWTGAEVVEPSADALVGTILHETYLIVRVIGQGGMGRVYEAQHTRIASKRFAIKVLHSEFASDPEIRRRFQHEAEAAAKVEHPGVVGTYDIGETAEGACYLVCEYLAGEDLNDYLTDGGALRAGAVVHIGRQLCSALGAAHGRGVIHRDLKPHNVFVLRSEGAEVDDSGGKPTGDFPSVKVLDFGLSRFLERDTEMTKAGIILGTPGYMAPEQAGGLGTDVRTDVYGIGALLFALATGRAPFKEETPQQTVLSVLSQVPPRPRELVASIPVPLEIVIQRAMARAPDERYQSAKEMELALEELEEMGTSRDNRTRRASDPAAPRLQFVLWTLAALVFGVPALTLALISLLEARGIEYQSFRPSTLEWLLFALLCLVSFFITGVALRRFRRQIWNDSARVVALLPWVRGPVRAGTLAYAVSAVIASSILAFRSFKAEGAVDIPEMPLLLCLVVLPVNALFAAIAALLWDFSRKLSRPFLRALWGVGSTTGAATAAALLLVFALVGPASLAPRAARPASQFTTQHQTDENRADAEAPAPASSKRLAAVPPPVPAVVEPSEALDATKQEAPRERAPSRELATAQSLGPKGLEQLLEKYPQDGKILVSLVLAHASRAETLDLSLRAIARLMEVEPEFSRTSDVLFILKKGLLSRGETHAIALEVLEKHMGEAAGDLIYGMLTEHPKQQARLKKLFLKLRTTKQVSLATSIAYDLRYAPSCHARLALLSRAENEGDQRSVQLLLGLSAVPKSCSWYRKCRAQCPAEAKQFRKSMAAIRARLAE